MIELVRPGLRCYGLAMRPHPLFKNRSIPLVHVLGEVTLRALSVHDLERDFSAVMESAADIKAANPGSSWPDGLTMEKNLIDLAWHQREFEARRSFAWVIEDAGGSYLGACMSIPQSTETTPPTWSGGGDPRPRSISRNFANGLRNGLPATHGHR